MRDPKHSHLNTGAAVIATIRRATFNDLTQPGHVRDPAGQALEDRTLVTQQDWTLAWSKVERVRLGERVHHPGLLAAAARGVSPSVYCVAGPQLLATVDKLRRDEENPARYLLVRAVLDWTRTGARSALPAAVADPPWGAAGHEAGCKPSRRSTSTAPDARQRRRRKHRPAVRTHG